MNPDPAEILPDTVDAILEAAIADGMNPDLSELTLTFAKDGSVSIKATPSDGSSPYTNDMSADELAAALGMDVTEDVADGEAPPASEAPAQGEKGGAK